MNVKAMQAGQQMPQMMQTVEMTCAGGPEVLAMGERPVPVPKPSEVLIKTIAAGVNGPDLMQRRGLYPPPKGASDLLGLEVSGEVAALGDDVTGWSVGDAICGLTNGGAYAEFVAVEAAHCLPIPSGVSVIDAAGLCETYFTVWSNLFMDRNLPADSLVLVHGGAGGIGSTAIQLSKALGHRVFTTCSGTEDLKFCTDLGADRPIDYRSEDFVEIVRAAGGANLILDIVGGDYVARNIKASATDATIVQLAFRAGSQVDIDLMPIMLKRLTLTGSTLRSRSVENKARIASDLLNKVWPMFEEGSLRPHTFKIFPFGDATSAHQVIEAGSHRGKILLVP